MLKLWNQMKKLNLLQRVDVVSILLWASVLTLAIGLPVATYLHYTADKIELIANDWHCTAYKSVSSSIIVGKSIVPTHRQICITWEMNK
jgi:hypothetical protein